MQKFLQQQVISNPQNQANAPSMFSSAQGKTKKHNSSTAQQRVKQTQILQSHYATGQPGANGQRKAYLAAIKGIKASG